MELRDLFRLEQRELLTIAVLAVIVVVVGIVARRAGSRGEP